MTGVTPPPISAWPKARPNGTKIACPLCGATGYSPSDPLDPPPHHWAYAHLQPHVACECGAIKLPHALGNHRRSKRHKMAMMALKAKGA